MLGVIENMSTHICTSLRSRGADFRYRWRGHDGADFDVDLLGKLPLDARIREQADSGHPTVASDPESAAAQPTVDCSANDGRARRPGKDYSAKFPKIVVE